MCGITASVHFPDPGKFDDLADDARHHLGTAEIAQEATCPEYIFTGHQHRQLAYQEERKMG